MVNRNGYKAAGELGRRRYDGLEMFRAMPTQMPIFESTATELSARGGNRAGKTVCAAVKTAAVARGKPVYGPDGQPIEQRMPWQKDRDLLVWIVGLQWDHLGQTIWRVLFKRGLYKIIRDEETLQWRAYNPFTDSHREHEAKPSFPLIPMDEVKGGLNGIAWENKKERQFSRIELHNGTVIHGFASTGEVKQGDPVDYIWIDEEIAMIGHYAEWQARLSDTKGRIVWSTLSRSNGALMNLSHRAAEQARELEEGTREKVDVQEITLRFSANPHIDDDEKRKRLEGWDEDERRMRDEGEFIIGNLKIYPQFDRQMHRAIYDNPERDDALSRVLRERNGDPPKDWTRELILDPGTAKPGVLFGAIPPREFWAGGEPYFVVYDEIYIPRFTAQEIAQRVQAKSRGYVFQRFIIDGQAARQTPMGFAGTIGANYSKEFLKCNLLSVETNTQFIPGDPNFATRSQLVESWLAFRPCGTPQLRIVVDKCPNLVDQLERNLKKIEKGPNGETVVVEKPASGQKDDLRAALEYWASRYPKYVEPPEVHVAAGGPGMRAYNKIQEMFGRKKPEGRVYCGPGEAA